MFTGTRAGLTPSGPHEGELDVEPVVLYQNERTRVSRITIGHNGATAICKEALGPNAMARIQNEIAILDRLSGVDGLPRQIASELSDVHTIVFEDRAGRSLAEVVEAGPLPAERLPGLALRLATIIAGVHRAGVVHRDLNPTNVLLCDADGEAMLVDFDLA